MRRGLTVAALLVLVLLTVAWAGGGFDRLALAAAGWQHDFQNAIARALRGARAGQAGAVWALLGACFAYGLAHAAGPGHGKVLVGGYGVARRVPMLRLALIALAAALGQAVTAVMLVYAGIWLLDLGREALVGVTEEVFAPASYGAIGLIGLWLAWRGLRRLRGGAGHDHPHDHQHHDHDHAHCGHAHGPTLAEVERAANLREVFALIAGIAIRPCTGALFVLIITWQMGIAGLGVAGTFAMAAGTGLVTVAVGLGAGVLRGGVLAGVMDSPRAASVAAMLELGAGVVVAVLAAGLLLRAL
jgi:nickel/cobalt transporter (NicO) family protein